MTTNIEQAARILIREGMFDAEAHCYAQALADAGRLMPVPPRPMEVISSDWAKFNEHIEVIAGDVRVYFAGDFGEYPENLTPAEAREQAAYLNAAADYAEQEQDNA